MYYYKKSQPSEEFERATTYIAYNCYPQLDMRPAKIVFVENTFFREESILSHDLNGNGFADPSTRTIYINTCVSMDQLVKTVAHECFHISEGDHKKPISEARADRFGVIMKGIILGKYPGI